MATMAFGWKAHSGWAALVVLESEAGRVRVIDRRRVDLVAAGEDWAKQPYHAAEKLPAPEARALVERGRSSAKDHARGAMRDALQRARDAGHVIAVCGVVSGEPMPAWSVDQILAVHPRMHQAEGALFRDALVAAAGEFHLSVAAVPEKRLQAEGAGALAVRAGDVAGAIADLGRSLGPPWGKDQKQAALAALIALARERQE